MSLKSTKSTLLYAKWSNEECDALVSRLLKAKKYGRMTENNFKSSVWTSIAQSFQDPLKRSSRVCETKWARMKKDYKGIKLLRETPGFGWDADRKLVTANPDVWDTICRPDLAKWRRFNFPWYDDISQIFGQDVRNGTCNFVNDTSGNGEERTVFDFTSPETSMSSLNTLVPPLNHGSLSSLYRLSENKTLAVACPTAMGEISDSKSMEKTNGPTVMEKMSEETLSTIANNSKTSFEAQATQIALINSSLEGQAQRRVQDETCLTEEGKLIMLDLLGELTLARAYLTIKEESLRVKWLKRQLQKADENIEELYID
ncbi:hypothetical protein K3495_g6366 [Podosphaera aphanis]|nr:hypothetical protein K3495_g6366 [Podosphaera aphanis]